MYCHRCQYVYELSRIECIFFNYQIICFCLLLLLLLWMDSCSWCLTNWINQLNCTRFEDSVYLVRFGIHIVLNQLPVFFIILMGWSVVNILYIYFLNCVCVYVVCMRYENECNSIFSLLKKQIYRWDECAKCLAMLHI